MDDAFEYCRAVEAYLCKANGGHLIRIVGPAFEQVKGWAAQGIPLKVVYRGIDRTCDRHHAKGGRRRPLRIEFCDADVLATFDEWRRAMGADGALGGESTEGDRRVPEQTSARKGSLASHIERAVSRLLAVRTSGSQALADAIATTVSALDELVTHAREARGDARTAIVERLAQLDANLLSVARQHVDPDTAAALQREADADLAPFMARMSEDDRRRAFGLAYDRLMRETLGLPDVRFD